MKLTHKISLGFFFVGFFIVLTGMTAFLGTGIIRSKVILMTETTSPAVQFADDLNIILVKNNQIVHAYITEYNDAGLNELRRGFDEQNDFFDESERNLRKLLVDEALVKQLNALSKKYDLFKEKAEKIIASHNAEIAESDAFEQKRYREVKAALMKQLDDDTTEAVTLLEEIADEVVFKNEEAYRSSLGTVKSTRFLMLFITLIGLGCAAVAGFFFIHVMVRPMQELVEAARKVGEGNFDVQVQEVRSHDELGNLTNTFNKMVESLRNMLEESPRLKQFMQFAPAAEKTAPEKEKYALTEGTSYLIKETHSKKAFDIFLDKVTHHCQGFCLSRTNPELIKKQYHLEKTPILWLSDTKDTDTFSSSDLLIIGKVIVDFLTKGQKSIVLLDRLDYLIARHGFDEVLKFIIKVNDKVMVTNAIFLIPVDPALIKPADLSFLEKEMQQFTEGEEHVDLTKDLFDALQFIESSKRLGKHVTFKDIGQKFMITAPTTQKRLQDLHQRGLIHIIKTGRNKLIELTEKAYPLLSKK